MNHDYTKTELVYACETSVKQLTIALDKLKVDFHKSMTEDLDNDFSLSWWQKFKGVDKPESISDDSFRIYGNMLTLADSIDMMNNLKTTIEKSKRDVFPLIDKELFILRNVLEDVDPSEFENIETSS